MSKSLFWLSLFNAFTNSSRGFSARFLSARGETIPSLPKQIIPLTLKEQINWLNQLFPIQINWDKMKLTFIFPKSSFGRKINDVTHYGAETNLYVPLSKKFSLKLRVGGSTLSGDPQFYQYIAPSIDGIIQLANEMSGGATTVFILELTSRIIDKSLRKNL